MKGRTDAVEETLPATPANLGTVATLASDAPVPASHASPLALEVVEPSRYAHVRELARGGMGRIRVARDRRLDREVAIKELLHDSSESRFRFAREVRITAKLQHPSIVNVLEAGCWPDGAPFYVMKLIAGDSLDRVIARRASGAQRLALLPHVIDVVEAIAFAHSKGVIHRDLKPGNVLVGDFGETVVVDWGLARETTEPLAPVSGPHPTSARPEEGATVEGAVLGTPAYMAPEQAAGDPLDARADVYAIGALLFHVLAGRPPIEATSLVEMIAKASAGERAHLAEVAPELPADLVAIVEKTMAFRASDRYPTAEEVAKELRRFEAGQLVGAQRYTLWQLVKRWIARHRAAVSVGGLAVLTIAVLAIVGVRRILAEQAATTRQREVADRHRVDAEALLSYLLADVSQALAKTGNVGLREDVATTVIRYYAEHPAHSVADKHRRIDAHIKLGGSLLDQRDLVRADAQFREAQRIASSVVAEHPADLEARVRSTQARARLADTWVVQGKSVEALAERRAALAAYEQLVARVPAVQADIARLRIDIGRVLLDQGDPATALAEVSQGRALIDAVLREHVSTAALGTSWLAYHAAGDIAVRRGELEVALAQFQAAFAVAERMVAMEPKNLGAIEDRTTSNDRIAEVFLQLERTEEALAAYERGLEIARALTLRDPANVSWRRDLGAAHAKVGNALGNQQAYDKALAAYREALVIWTPLAAIDETDQHLQRDLATLEMELAAIQFIRRDDASSMSYARAALARLERVVQRAPHQVDNLRLLAKAYDDLGSLYVERNELPIALDHVQKGLAVARQLYELDRTDVLAVETLAVSYESLADLQIEVGDAGALASVRAMRELQDALVALDPGRDEFRRGVARGQHKLATLLARTSPVAARVELEAALAWLEPRVKSVPDDARASAELASVKQLLARCCDQK